MQLTMITQEMVDEEYVSLKKAFEFLVKGLDSKMISWASYGEYDMNVVHEQCSTFGLGNPFGSVHSNVKALFKLRRSDYGMDAPYEGVMGKRSTVLAIEVEMMPMTLQRFSAHTPEHEIGPPYRLKKYLRISMTTYLLDE